MEQQNKPWWMIELEKQKPKTDVIVKPVFIKKGKKIKIKDAESLVKGYKVAAHNAKLIGDMVTYRATTKKLNKLNYALRHQDEKGARRYIDQAFVKLVKSTDQYARLTKEGKVQIDLYRLNKKDPTHKEFIERAQKNFKVYQFEQQQKRKQNIRYHRSLKNRGDYELYDEVVQAMGGMSNAQSRYQFRLEEMQKDYNVNEDIYDLYYTKPRKEAEKAKKAGENVQVQNKQN